MLNNGYYGCSPQTRITICFLHFQLFDDNASGIHFTTGRRHQRAGSINSISSIADSMRRVNTASSFFKRLLSRSDSQTPTNATAGPEGGQSASKIPKSASNTSLAGSKILNPGTVRITDQVIEEVDEQMTITSMRQPESRPKAEDLFNQGPACPVPSGPPPPSKPVDVPMRRLGPQSSGYERPFATVGQNMDENFGADDLMVSCSAPVTNYRPLDEYDLMKTESKESGVSGGDTTDLQEKGDDDEFEKLRVARERERMERQKQNIARSISTTQGSTSNVGTLNVDLVEALAASIADDMQHHQ